MKTLFHSYFQFLKTLLPLVTLSFIFIFTLELFPQDKSFVGTQSIRQGNNSLYQTIGEKKSSGENTSFNNLITPSTIAGDKYVLGGNLIW